MTLQYKERENFLNEQLEAYEKQKVEYETQVKDLETKAFLLEDELELKNKKDLDRTH